MYAIDFLPVGDGESCGDAIALCFAHPNPANNNKVVVVIDGGYVENGAALKRHINDHYGTNRVDLVISTHPDSDHLNGIPHILGNMEVGELLMHLPWQHVGESYRFWKARPNLKNNFTKSLTGAETLARLADAIGVPVTQPFTRLTRFDGLISIMGPSVDYYQTLLPDFGTIPESNVSRFIRTLTSVSDTVLTKTLERLDLETLTDAGETSAKNNSSVIVQVRHGNRRALFTGDAGQEALQHATHALNTDSPLATEPLTFIQVPHHGSRRNVGPSVLNALLGEPGSRQEGSTIAYVSASKDAPKHPARRVTNAFHRRGCFVGSTEGRSIALSQGFASRESWTPLEPVPFQAEVEDDEDD